MSPDLYPNWASPTARLTDTVVFPTPPFPDPTAIRFLTPGMGSLGIWPGWLGVIASIVTAGIRSCGTIRGKMLRFTAVCLLLSAGGVSAADKPNPQIQELQRDVAQL